MSATRPVSGEFQTLGEHRLRVEFDPNRSIAGQLCCDAQQGRQTMW